MIQTHKDPLFSLVIPTRNRAELVGYCLACIAQQDFYSFQVILSDNGSHDGLCDKQFAAYSGDPRFKYVRPPREMNMSEHWEFAVSQATGDYVAILSEKFMLRPDALAVLSKLIDKYRPELLTWQFERFEVQGNDVSKGHYHPLMKPVVPSFYDPAAELKRRFSFETPSFYRPLRHKNSYGKMYSGCVKRSVLSKVKSHFGQVFPAYNPDFTSMVGILNECQSAMDVGQSLMMVVFAEGISNGDATKVSLNTVEVFLKTYNESVGYYANQGLFKGCWVGHNNCIAIDYLRMKQNARYGPLVHTQLNSVNLLSWMISDFYDVSDFGSFDKELLECHLLGYKDQLSLKQQERIDANLKMKYTAGPCSYEIFHAGLTKMDDMPERLSAADMANMHWVEFNAPPRKNVLSSGENILDAVNYFYLYSVASCALLKLS
ncbi:glycosyl transferase [Rheinheimera sp. A13L]|uniref:glycosyltransferase family 2 protein n=1 Tax=Rheinheimera sp. A13L TaxID=506534 RepID=UPI00021255E4|nr:glycosyltransferase family A protein [Rheinheimera sp. A13L]EGM78238.1 glycosyl transferase [Rheinheimera sp. A13L]